MFLILLKSFCVYSCGSQHENYDDDDDGEGLSGCGCLVGDLEFGAQLFLKNVFMFHFTLRQFGVCWRIYVAELTDFFLIPYI